MWTVIFGSNQEDDMLRVTDEAFCDYVITKFIIPIAELEIAALM